MTAPFRVAALLAALVLPAALPATALAASPDPSIAPLLKEMGYEYEVDDDGDYKLVMAMPDSDRTQLVFVRSTVERFGATAVREVWSPAWAGEGDGDFPAAVANRLLQAAGELKLGGWARHGRYAVMVVQVDAAASAGTLEDAITSAAMAADRMELELSGLAGDDEY